MTDACTVTWSHLEHSGIYNDEFKNVITPHRYLLFKTISFGL